MKLVSGNDNDSIRDIFVLKQMIKIEVACKQFNQTICNWISLPETWKFHLIFTTFFEIFLYLIK